MVIEWIKKLFNSLKQKDFLFLNKGITYQWEESLNEWHRFLDFLKVSENIIIDDEMLEEQLEYGGDGSVRVWIAEIMCDVWFENQTFYVEIQHYYYDDMDSEEPDVRLREDILKILLELPKKREYVIGSSDSEMRKMRLSKVKYYEGGLGSIF